MDAIKILMVDDEARMRKLVKDFLSIKGYRVLEAEDGEAAVDIFFKEKDIDLLPILNSRGYLRPAKVYRSHFDLHAVPGEEEITDDGYPFDKLCNTPHK